MSKRFQVVITDFLTDDLQTEQDVLGDIADIVGLNAFSEDELRGNVESADALLVYHHLQVTEQTISRLENCKLIVRCGVGYDNVDGAAARKHGIPLVNVPDYGTEEVADSAIGLTLSLTRGINFFNTWLRQHPEPWTPEPVQPLQRLRGQVFGIVGLGRIGSATALRAKAHGFDVVFYDPYKDDGWDKALGIRRVESLDELLEQSYVVSLHCFLSEETRHLMNAETIAKMPRASFLVNTARGDVVDLSAIPGAIESGHLAGAGIDVLPLEPPADDDPFVAAWKDPNHPAYHRVIVNPHSAFYCEQGLLDMRLKGAQSCRRVLTGLDPRNVVN